jgi:hypothetical protein
MSSITLQYFYLLKTIIHHGRLQHSGYNFNENRKKNLSDLTDFTTKADNSTALYHVSFPINSWIWKNSYMRNIVSQASYLKNCFKKKGGHLHISAVNLCYIRIPKAANTSLSFVMLEAIYPSLGKKDLHSWQINALTDIHLRSSLTLQERSSALFTIVRNPFARLISAYRAFFKNQSDFFIYQDYLFGIFSKTITFKEFVKRLQYIPDSLKDQHLKPQHHFLKFYETKKLTVTVLKLEEPKQIQAFLTNYQLTLPTLNKSKEPYDYRMYYDDETLNIAYLIYKQDILRFNYNQEYETLKIFVNQQKL